MNAPDRHLHVLLIEDDQESLDQMKESLPQRLKGCRLHYDPCNSFDDALERLEWKRYDMVLTDIYRDPPDSQNKGGEENNKARLIIAEIRKRRFCPIVTFTDGSFPDEWDPEKEPFKRQVDKTKPGALETAISDLIETGIPEIARRLHEDLDQASGPRYLWDFLERNWKELEELRSKVPDIVERLIRRRAAIQIGYLDPEDQAAREREHVSAPDFYLMPPVSKTLRLGSILHSRGDDESWYVVLTPHCYLETQEGDTAPRADHVLLVRVFLFHDTLSAVYRAKNPWSGDEKDKLRRRIQSPADRVGKPQGRFWFLPGFLSIPDAYCDFLQVASVSLNVAVDYDPVAVLDSPYAEALQSCFNSFYASVGRPNLDPGSFEYLLPTDSPSE